METIRNKKAFTIVELLVVMAVIGILITLAVVGIQALQQSQRNTARLNDIRSIVGKLEEYNAKYRKYPFAVDDISSELIFDTAGPKVGVCLYKPNHSQTFDCDVSATHTDLFSKLELSPGLFGALSVPFVVPENSLSYSAVDCSTFSTPISADNYFVYYSTSSSSNPQQYALFGCLENGKTQNFGSMNL